jgi:hypothetical protein
MTKSWDKAPEVDSLKNEYTEHEEDGVRETRATYYDPETKTRVEEVKIEKTEEETDKDKV